jgi:hypothetical protein
MQPASSSKLPMRCCGMLSMMATRRASSVQPSCQSMAPGATTLQRTWGAHCDGQRAHQRLQPGLGDQVPDVVAVGLLRLQVAHRHHAAAQAASALPSTLASSAAWPLTCTRKSVSASSRSPQWLLARRLALHTTCATSSPVCGKAGCWSCSAACQRSALPGVGVEVVDHGLARSALAGTAWCTTTVQPARVQVAADGQPAADRSRR